MNTNINVNAANEFSMALIPQDMISRFLMEVKREDKVQSIDPISKAVTERMVPGGEYKGKRFPGTKTRERIEWNEAIGSYNIGKYLLPENKDELIQIINDMALSYPSGPNKDQLIGVANPRNRRDPFFVNYHLRLETEEGYYVFNPNKPIDLLFLEHFKNCNYVSTDPNAENTNNEIRYFLVQIGFEKAKQISKSNKKMDLIQKFMKLSAGEKIDIAYCLKENVDKDTDIEYLSSVLFRKIDAPEILFGNRDTADEMDELMNLPKDKLKLRSLVSRAMSERLFESKNGYYYFNTEAIGKNVDEVIAYFDDYKNNEAYGFLQKELNVKFMVDEKTIEKKSKERTKPDFNSLKDEEE